jgi:hypothetical protein
MDIIAKEQDSWEAVGEELPFMTAGGTVERCPSAVGVASPCTVRSGVCYPDGGEDR